MGRRNNQLLWNVLAFALLFTVSLYRQLSLRFLPNDPCRTWVLFGCYVFLLLCWAGSVLTRVTQRLTRSCLLLEAAVMLFGMTVRFLQDTFWTSDLFLTRASGFWVGATLLPMAALGLFASFGVGRGDDYRPPLWSYLLWLPVLVMTWLLVTDESRHFVCYIDPAEPQPNLEFHPSTGMYLVVVLMVLMMVARVLVIYRRNRGFTAGRLARCLIPLFEPLLSLTLSFSFFMVSLELIPWLEGKEVLEFYAKLYYAEVLTWELYMYLGLVPVNTDYPTIFENSSFGMQLVQDNGTVLRSKNAASVRPEELAQLRQSPVLPREDGQELHLQRLPHADFLWNKDVTQLRQTIDELNRTAEALAQESSLLEAELRTKSREASLAAKNRIYDELTDELSPQLLALRRLSAAPRNADEQQTLRRLCLLGTYVKRRCDLRLIQRLNGGVRPTDLRLSLSDLISALNRCGCAAVLIWEDFAAEGEGAVSFFDFVQAVLEASDLNAESVELRCGGTEARLSLQGVTELSLQTLQERWPVQARTDGDRLTLLYREGGIEREA